MLTGPATASVYLGTFATTRSEY